MKLTTLPQIALWLALPLLLLYSCKKDSVIPTPPNTIISEQAKPYKDESFGSYSFSRSRPSLTLPNTWEIYYTADASGSSTVMPAIKTVYNFIASTGANGSTFTGYPINKALRLDMPDFGLVPEYVNQIVYDDDGNSIWFQMNSLSVENSSNIRHFSGTSNVVGGTGKFANATGSVLLNGHMSAFNLDDFYIKNEGHISY